MNHILVTGATGNVGRQVVAQLQTSDCRVRALTRNPDGANLPPHVEAVRGDLTDSESLDKSLAGIGTVFLVWAEPAASAHAVVSRIARHAGRIVLLTSPHKTPHPLFQQPNPLRGIFEQVEREIEASGLEWTFLRPGMFADNAIGWWAPQIRSGSVVRWPYADSPTAPIDVRDIAAVAVRTLLDSGHNGAEYVLTGPESLSHQQQVQIIGEAIGRPLRYEELTPDEARLQLGFPEPAITMLLDAWRAALGQPAYMSNTVSEITGRKARTFREWANDHAAAFES
jgi:uncharacterized protein YbjT (DUF2867 family)